jgi:hypothetical protein
MFLPYFPHRMSLALPKGVSSDGKISNLRMYFCSGDGPGAGLRKFIFVGDSNERKIQETPSS